MPYTNFLIKIRMKYLWDLIGSAFAGGFIWMRIAAWLNNIDINGMIITITAIIGLIYLLMQIYILFLKTRKFKRDNKIKGFL